MTKKLYVTIDTEMDADIHWGKKWPAEYTSIINGVPELYRPLWDRYGVKPIYFVSPEVLDSAECCQILKDEYSKGAVIGAHLHGEYIEPDSTVGQNMETGNVPFPCIEYDSELEKVKIANLKAKIEEKLGITPIWYRAARFGADADTLTILKELGFKYDSSFTPYIDWSGKGGPNHKTSTVWPCDIEGIREYPVTITGKRLGFLGRLLPDNWLFYSWLRPTHMTCHEMKNVIRRMEKANRHDELDLVMMFHSMEPMVNKTPYVRYRWMQRYYMWRLEQVLKFARSRGYIFG